MNRASVLRAPDIGALDLSISVTALAPADASTQSADKAVGLVGNHREQVLLQALDDSPITRWMDGSTASWPVTARRWEIADPGDGRRYTGFTANLSSTSKNTSHGRTPIRTGVHVRTGADGARPFLVADFEVGLWLADLDQQRLPAERRHDSRPLPAALSLNEIVRLLTAMISTGIESASRMFQQLLESPGEHPSLLLRVELSSPSGIDAVVRLQDLQRAGTGGSRTASLTHHFEFTPRRDVPEQASRAWALALLGEVLLRSGYRNYDQELLASPG